MLFGLSNAIVSFQGYINKILAKKFDILIHSNNLGKGYIEAISIDFIRMRFVF